MNGRGCRSRLGGFRVAKAANNSNNTAAHCTNICTFCTVDVQGHGSGCTGCFAAFKQLWKWLIWATTTQAGVVAALFRRNSVYVGSIFVGAFAFGIGFDLLMTKYWEVSSRTKSRAEASQGLKPRSLRRRTTRASCGKISGTRWDPV